MLVGVETTQKDRPLRNPTASADRSRPDKLAAVRHPTWTMTLPCETRGSRHQGLGIDENSDAEDTQLAEVHQ